MGEEHHFILKREAVTSFCLVASNPTITHHLHSSTKDASVGHGSRLYLDQYQSTPRAVQQDIVLGVW